MNDPSYTPFDQAVALQQQVAEVGWSHQPRLCQHGWPFGGISAPQLPQAVWLHPQRLASRWH
jgi:hypothetical protein